MWFSNSYADQDGVLVIAGHKFGYNDGDRDEEYILATVRAAHDISSRSTELEQAIVNWSSRYHLSSDRANVYRSMRIPAGARILEIGSGCGAITRYLGETGSNVAALEGSLRRARITRSRTRDLPNVTVICGSFEDVKFVEKFDYVICNGVLEYAGLFVKGEDPAQRFLALLSELLSPAGCVVVAIENKTGLRYFSSASEEHTGVMFDGIEGYHRFPRGPQTFARAELRAKMARHFPEIEHLLPLPDYKFPAAIIRESLTDIVDCSELFASLDSHDYGASVPPQIHERLAWSSLAQGKLLGEFANSFVIVAGKTPPALFDQDWQGDIYSRRRRAEYAVRTRLVAGKGGSVHTMKSRLAAPQGDSPLTVSPGGTAAEWIAGPSVHTLLARAFVDRCLHGGLEDRIRKPVGIWWAALKNDLDRDETFPCDFVDCNWQNTIVRDGLGRGFDQEWKSGGRVPALMLIYRSVVCFTGVELPYVHRWARRPRRCTQIALIKSTARIVGVKFSMGHLIAAIKLDAAFALQAQGRRQPTFNNFVRLFVPFWALRTLSLARRRRSLAPAYARRIWDRICAAARRR